MANIIAENMFAQVNSEGNMYSIMQEITDHRKDKLAVPDMGWHDYPRRTSGETQDYCKRLGVTGSMEGWIIKLGETQGFESVKPDQSG